MVSNQPSPTPNDKPATWDLVKKDIDSRDKFGEKKYGTRLQPENGRDSLIDLYEEQLDSLVYTRNLIYERDNTPNYKQALLDILTHGEHVNIGFHEGHAYVVISGGFVSDALDASLAKLREEGLI